MKIQEVELNLIASTLLAASFPAPTNIALEQTDDEAGTAILRYQPNCDARDAMIGTGKLEDAGLDVAYDGDPSTTECGPDHDTDPMTVVIMVRYPLFKDPNLYSFKKPDA